MEAIPQAAKMTVAGDSRVKHEKRGLTMGKSSRLDRRYPNDLKV